MTSLPNPPKEGIYYVCFTPMGWQFRARCFEPGEDLDHPTWWEQEVARDLAGCWWKPLRVPVRTMSPLLANHPYAFPRGRVSRTLDTFLVLHGADLKPSMKVSKRMIEQSFGIAGRCEWLFDEHEQCQQPDQEAVCRLLKIEPKWSAV